MEMGTTVGLGESIQNGLLKRVAPSDVAQVN